LHDYPDFLVAHGQLVWLYAQRDDYPSAITELTKTRLLEGQPPQTIATDELALRKAFADRGKQGFWGAMRATITSAEYEAAEDFFSPQVYARLGDVDNAVATLQRCYEQRVFFTIFIKVDPAYDSLRSDPRFLNLVRRMGLHP
jgi:hypothetical protein